jgi:hypothetical protein
MRLKRDAIRDFSEDIHMNLGFDMCVKNVFKKKKRKEKEN